MLITGSEHKEHGEIASSSCRAHFTNKCDMNFKPKCFQKGNLNFSIEVFPKSKTGTLPASQREESSSRGVTSCHSKQGSQVLRQGERPRNPRNRGAEIFTAVLLITDLKVRWGWVCKGLLRLSMSRGRACIRLHQCKAKKPVLQCNFPSSPPPCSFLTHGHRSASWNENSFYPAAPILFMFQREWFCWWNRTAETQ